MNLLGLPHNQSLELTVMHEVQLQLRQRAAAQFGSSAS